MDQIDQIAGQIEHITTPITNKIRFIEYFNGKAALMTHCREIIRILTEAIGERTLEKHDNLEKSRKFIFEYFHRCGTTPVEQAYSVNGMETANIIAEIRGTKLPDEVIIIGAHYDTVSDTVGANDNASGIAALLELHRLLKKHKHKRTIRFAAFTLEEPPYFETENMGSFIYARKCSKQNDNIKLMICLDMLAYGGSFVKQQIPLTSMLGKYPAKGNYLVAASLPPYRNFTYMLKNIYNESARVPIYDAIAPASLKGINNSDHASFHKFGIPNLMITDTGFYRSNFYHTEKDTIDSLNFRFLMNNIVNLYKTIREILNIKNFPEKEN
ncbi:MAG: M28 family peptidase [Spirochaetes bacterium]|nr:M28 family peptidase [Spirochaetota bacterium]